VAGECGMNYLHSRNCTCLGQKERPITGETKVNHWF